MKTNTIEITDWHQFSQEVKDLGYKSWIFRGHSFVQWRLVCTLWRELKTLLIPETSFLAREKELLDTFKSCAHHYLSHLPKDEETLEWWSLMQHFGAPTRMIDWTYSPYCAAFFAIEQSVRWQADPAEPEFQDFCVYGLYVANILKHNKDNNIKVLDYDFATKKKHKPFVGLFDPRLKNQRLISQQGVFTVQSVIEKDLETLLQDYPDRPEDKGKGLVKFVFKNNRKVFANYISFLHRMNISNASLFPGIEGLGRSLRLDLMNIASKF